MAASSRGQQLVRRLRRVLQSWPVDSSKKGRDLGEYLNKSYEVKFKNVVEKDAQKAKEIIESLEKLQSNHYRRLYKRENELGFSGDLDVRNASILSNDNLSEMKEQSRTVWERIAGRNK